MNANTIIFLTMGLLALVSADESSCDGIQSSATGFCPGRKLRNKDLAQADTLVSLVNRIYNDFETLNYADLRTILHPNIELCVNARFNLGCYKGVEEVISYVSLIKYEETELLRLWSMNPYRTIYTDLVNNAADTIAEWKFFSYPIAKNVTLYMHDSFEFDCNNKLVKYVSWGDANNWTLAQIPPISDHNSERICNGANGLSGIQQACTGANQQYASVAACKTFIDSLPDEVVTTDVPPQPYPFGLGNSAGCRDWHLGLARFAPEIHCPHVGPTGGMKCVGGVPPA